MAIYTQFTDESTIEAAYEVLGRTMPLQGTCRCSTNSKTAAV